MHMLTHLSVANLLFSKKKKKKKCCKLKTHLKDCM